MKPLRANKASSTSARTTGNKPSTTPMKSSKMPASKTSKPAGNVGKNVKPSAKRTAVRKH